MYISDLKVHFYMNMSIFKASVEDSKILRFFDFVPWPVTQNQDFPQLEPFEMLSPICYAHCSKLIGIDFLTFLR